MFDINLYIDVSLCCNPFCFESVVAYQIIDILDYIINIWKMLLNIIHFCNLPDYCLDHL